MTRKELIERICPTDASNDCSAGESGTSCSRCGELLNKMLDEYDAQVKADAIDEVIIYVLNAYKYGALSREQLKVILNEAKEVCR